MENIVSLKGSTRELNIIIENLKNFPKATQISYNEEDIEYVWNASSLQNIDDVVEYRYEIVHINSNVVKINKFNTVTELLKYIKLYINSKGIKTCRAIIRISGMLYSVSLYDMVTLHHPN